jgi:transposase
MSKRRYKTVEFKHVDWNEIGNRIEGERAVLAVDVAKEDFVATLLDADGTALERFKWHHPQETAEVVERLVWLRQGRRLEAVMEPSGTYGDALAWQLRQGGIALYRVSPKRVHDAAEVYDGVPSLHDAKAAELIGRLHLQGVSQPWQEPAEARREVAAVLTRLRVCKARQQGAGNRLEAHLSRHWPESLSILGLDTATLPALISTYGDPASVAADPHGAEALMRRSGGPGLREEKIQALLASARHSLGVPCLAEEHELLRWLAADLLEARKQVHQIEREIERHVDHTPALTGMAAVIGKVSAAVLLAAVGAPQDYPDAGSYTKAIGLNLKERSSGKHQGQLKITKRGPSLARFYLYFAALRLIARDPLVKRWYERKTNRPGALKNKTVIALMRKLSKALWYIARGSSFDAEKLFHLKGVAST